MEEKKTSGETLAAFKRTPEFGVFQLTEYIHAFRASSDRARYVIFITHAVSLLMLIAAWNYHRWSWSRQAAEKYYEERAVEKRQKYEQLLAEDAARKKIDAILKRIEAAPLAPPDALALRQAVLEAERAQRRDALHEALAARLRRETWLDHEYKLEWYGGQTAEFYGRGVFVPVPGLGASVHVNDMALMGGLVLLALTALLWIMLIRQHENLYLALFKIGLIRSIEGDEARSGDSVSNLLYHALAMAQVLSHPPTLARWNLRFRHYILHRIGAIIVYFAPALVHGGIVFQNILTHHRAYEIWGERFTHVRLGVQVFLSVCIFICCLLAFIYAASCESRWRKAFFQINSGLRRIEQRPWAEWVGLREGEIISQDLRRLARDLTYNLDVKPASMPRVETHVAERSRRGSELDMRLRHFPTLRGLWRCLAGAFVFPISKVAITQREIAKVVKYLYTECTGEEDGSPVRLRHAKVDQNELFMAGREVKRWEVKIRTDVEYPPS